MGYLTGTLDAHSTFDPKTDLRSTFERFTPENLEANRPVLAVLGKLAVQKNATLAQLALAWLLAQKPFIVPIPGTKKLDHLVENLGATRIELSVADLREMESAFAAVQVHGGRMSVEQMKVVQ
jgi:aryl-alcohol dehydrogenase-like predicted oxidoreductase